MNIEGDINWIKQELNDVTEPHLIEAIKQLLVYRRAKLEDSFYFSRDEDALKVRAEASLKSIENGNTRPLSEFKKEIENWKKK